MIEYRNPKMLEDNRIDCEINHEKFGWIPFTCDPDDTGAAFDAAELHAQMLTDANLQPYVPPTPEQVQQELAEKVRAQRDQKLVTEVDPVVSNPLRWADLSDEQKTQIADYRQALLDVPQQAGFPEQVEWPVKPEIL